MGEAACPWSWMDALLAPSRMRFRELLSKVKFRDPPVNWLHEMTRTAPALGLCLLLGGCVRGDVERVIDPPTVFTPVSQRDLQPIDTDQRLGLRSAASGAPSLEWDTPEGWQPLPATSMRMANFRVGGDADAECFLSLVRGGLALDNINRWRGQMGLEPVDEEAVEALPRIPLLGGQAVRVTLDGSYAGMGGGEGKPDYRMVGAILEIGANAVTVKMVGPRAILDPQDDAFDAFCASVRLPADAAGGGDLELTWETPEHWTAGRRTEMRAATFHPNGDLGVECVLFRFRRPAGGTEHENVVRWYEQMGVEMPAEGLAALPTIELLGQTRHLVDLAGSYTDMAGKGHEEHAMLAVFAEVPDWVVCVKMTGPAAVLADEREGFLAFCGSLRSPQ